MTTWLDIKARWEGDVTLNSETLYWQARADVLELCNVLGDSKPINVKTQLPAERQRCLWWHSQHERWYFGTWIPEGGLNLPGYFWGEITGYVCDGTATHWMPEPAAPEEVGE
jgi:hypothetical protein